MKYCPYVSRRYHEESICAHEAGVGDGCAWPDAWPPSCPIHPKMQPPKEHMADCFVDYETDAEYDERIAAEDARREYGR